MMVLITLSTSDYNEVFSQPDMDVNYILSLCWFNDVVKPYHNISNNVA